MAERGRPRGFDRAAALAAAMRVFWREGYQGASLSDLTGAMGIAAPSLYAAFGDKQALYLEALELYADTVGPEVWAGLNAGATAREGVEAVLLGAADGLTRADCPRGCMITLADGGESESLRDELRVRRHAMIELVSRKLDTAVAGGELPPGTRTGDLARFYITVHQGMSLQARDGATAEELRAVVRHAMTAWPRAAG